MYHEKHNDGMLDFRKPDQYSLHVLVGANTHDLPTLCGFWKGADIAQRESLGLLSNNSFLWVVRAMHVCLARTPSWLLIANMEDILGQEVQINLPGTDLDVYPNWRGKLPVALEKRPEHQSLCNVAAALNEVRSTLPQN